MEKLNETYIKFELPKLLKAYRVKTGYSQVGIAKELRVSQSKYSKLENGICEISALEWFRFCEITGLDPAHFFKNPPTPIAEIDETTSWGQGNSTETTEPTLGTVGSYAGNGGYYTE